MQTTRKETIQLMHEYIACSRYMCKALKDEFDTKDETLLRARRLKIIPKEGITKEGFKFCFHGGGCFFEFENGSINVDFGPDDRCDGFDSYRLYDFMETSKAEHYKSLQSQNIIETELQKMLLERIVIKPQVWPNPHLFYLTAAMYEAIVMSADRWK